MTLPVNKADTMCWIRYCVEILNILSLKNNSSIYNVLALSPRRIIYILHDIFSEKSSQYVVDTLLYLFGLIVFITT